MNVQEAMVDTLRWVIRGSRLLLHFVAGWSAETNIAGSPAYMPKRLPSRRCADQDGAL